MESTVKTRLLEVLKYKKISVNALSKLLKMPQTTVNNYVSGKRKISFELIKKISEAFPEINSEWILTGKGMMINSVAQTVTNIYGGGANEPEPRQSVIDQSSVINALIASNSAALDAKNETIAALGRELAAKDSVVALLRQQFSSLQSQVADLRAQLSAIRSSPATLLDYPFPIGTADDLKKTPSTPLK